MNKIFLSWKDIDDAVTSIAHRIKASDIEINTITGLARGGLIPAVMLSHKLNIPFHMSVSSASGNVLIVDDICDSGETLKRFSYGDSFYTATIHHKQLAIYTPDFYYSLAPDEYWIVYPWENNDSETIQDYLKK